MYDYRFPPNGRVQSETKGMTHREALGYQAAKVLEEAHEVANAVNCGEPREALLIECWDVIQAVEGILRFYSDAEVADAWSKTVQKCVDRGDYGQRKDHGHQRREETNSGHYTAGAVETIDKITAVTRGLTADQGYMLGNIIKYCDRAGLKGDAAEDLAKANDYAHRLLSGHWAHDEKS